MTNAPLPPGPPPPKGEPLPSAGEFFLKFPLYEFFKVNEGNREEIQQIQYYKGPLDAHCIGCKQSSIFERDASYTSYLDAEEAIRSRQFVVDFRCSRNSNHKMHFSVLVANRHIGKIGQFPSLADLHTTEIGKYRKVLGEERYREFARAVGLAAHGVGVGSFIYLRRIFESLVSEAFSSVPENEIDEKLYVRGRMDEKILLLRTHLPAFLVENRALYGILSKGVHSLTEEECLRHFETVRIGIEMILDEKIEEQERRSKLDRAKSALADLRGRMAD
jgi:hypothetical protein